jgi:hypothetical protein
MDLKRARALLGQTVEQTGNRPSEHTARPTLAQAGYKEANPDRTRKQCRNCLLWLSAKVECSIHDASIIAPPDADCGYHVFGKPQDQLSDDDRLIRQSVDPVDPKLSQLRQVNGGPSCDKCVAYQANGATQGACQWVRDSFDPSLDATVQTLGVCRLFELL